MKRFKFSLQAVHNLREMHLDAAEQEFAKVRAELSEAQKQLDEIRQLREAAMDDYLKLHESGEIQAAVIATHTEYIGSLMQLERKTRALITQIEQKLTTRRQLVTEAARQTETTANLRDRQKERHHLESARHEQKMLDEMAVAAAKRQGLLNS